MADEQLSFGLRHRGACIMQFLIVFGAIAVVLALTFGPGRRGNVARGKNVHRAARGSAARLCQAIEAYQALMNFLPAQKPQQGAKGAYENAGIVKQLNSVTGRDPLLRLAPEEKNDAGSFVDPWGKPYRVVMWKENPSDTLSRHFQVYSCGPNGEWELGKSDDVSARW